MTDLEYEALSEAVEILFDARLRMIKEPERYWFGARRRWRESMRKLRSAQEYLLESHGIVGILNDDI